MTKLIRNLWWLVLLISLALLVIHTLSLAAFKIDTISLGLLVLILLCPILPHIKKLKFKDFEAEIDSKAVEKIKKEVETKLASEDNKKNQKSQDKIKSIKKIIDIDHVLALAKLRIELEIIINKLYSSSNESNNSKDEYKSLVKIVRELTLRDVIPNKIAKPLVEILFFCNSAIHGKEVKKSDAKKIVKSGITIYNNIDILLSEFFENKIESTGITSSEVKDYKLTEYEITSIDPDKRHPKKNIRIVRREELGDFLNGFNENEEFIVELKKGRKTVAVKYIPTGTVHRGNKGGVTGCGINTKENLSHWVNSHEEITCECNGCIN